LIGDGLDERHDGLAGPSRQDGKGSAASTRHGSNSNRQHAAQGMGGWARLHAGLLAMGG
jgi:hypothetical protein